MMIEVLHYPRIKRVIANKDYTLLVTFENGKTKLYDMRPIMNDAKLGKYFTTVHDIDTFVSKVKVSPGGSAVEWDDMADIAQYELWTNGVEV